MLQPQFPVSRAPPFHVPVGPIAVGLHQAASISRTCHTGWEACRRAPRRAGERPNMMGGWLSALRRRRGQDQFGKKSRDGPSATRAESAITAKGVGMGVRSRWCQRRPGREPSRGIGLCPFLHDRGLAPEHLSLLGKPCLSTGSLCLFRLNLGFGRDYAASIRCFCEELRAFFAKYDPGKPEREKDESSQCGYPIDPRAVCICLRPLAPRLDQHGGHL